MATTKKSTKAKTKTTKSKATSSRKSTKTTKVSATSTKASSKQTKQQSNNSQMTMLQKIYALSIAAYIAVIGAAYMLMNSTSYQLSVGYWAKDDLASVNGTQFAPATQGLLDIQVKWIVMALAITSIIIPALYLTKLKSYHADGLKNKVLPLRWLDMAIASMIMVETAAILSGVLDLGTLKLVGGLMLVTMVLGWMAEKRTAQDGKPATAKYYLSMVTGLLPWLLIAMYAISTYIFGELRTAWFVYAIYVVLIVAASFIGKHQLESMKGLGKLKDYNVVEQKYALYSLLTRLAFASILIIGLMTK
ncbi:hypothetical protein KDA00_01365 [Candidatus Saccharibacteria bacterium]|nr:hypothetical protein [Candidatus Saccharibacteria bacterium]